MSDHDEEYTVAQLDADLQMIERARSLYPASPYLQQEWLHAVTIARQGSRGWLLDVKVHPIVRSPVQAPL